jgi:GTP-binding protein Era
VTVPVPPTPPFRAGYVAVLGWPNVGKSTLLNQLIGFELSIISAKPQTTQDAILGIRNEPGFQMIFVDTPGWLKPGDLWQAHMKKNIVRAMHDDADVLLWLVDPAPLSEEQRDFGSRLKEIGKPVVVVINKIDKLADRSVLGPLQTALKELLGAEIRLHAISAKSGESVTALRKTVAALLPEAPAYFPTDQSTDRWERFYASELIREQLLSRTEQEVPHASAVMIEEYREKPGHKDVIRATIFVETEGQKGIVVGHAGRTIKEIGQAARLRIEKLTGRPVHLELVVKIRKNWRKDAQFIKSLAAARGDGTE